MDTLQKIAAAVIVGCFAAMAITGARAQSTSCFAGASVGAGAVAQRFDDGSTRVDLGTQSLQIGPELGCNVKLTGFTFGGMLRYDLLDSKTHIGLDELKQNGRWMAAAKLGLDVNASTNLYAIAGIASTKFNLVDIQSITNRGWVAGAGLDIDIGKGPFAIFTEYNAIFYRERAFDNLTTFRPTEHIVRAGIRMSLGK